MIRLPIRFVEDLGRAASIEQVLATAAAWLPRLVEADRVKITFLDDGRLIARTHRLDGRHEGEDDLAPVRPGSPRDRVLTCGQMLELGPEEIARDPDPSMQRLYDDGMRRMAFLPMQAGGRTVGVVGMARRNDRCFSHGQVRQATAAGNWIAGQALLFQQLRLNARMAETDPLTGLANRARLMRVLAGPRALHLPDSRGRVVGVLHIDLDHFKEINDRHGHAVGDRILVRAAGVMRSTAGPSDLVARIGGDEFVIVTRSDPQGRHLDILATTLAERLAEPFEDGNLTLTCQASIGAALAGLEDRSAERLIANADLALYEVKRRGRGGAQIFTGAMRRAAELRRRRAGDLRRAIANREFEPFFQPVIALDTGAVTGCEIRARWRHPERGVLAPADFLDVAHGVGLAQQIDAEVRELGLAEVKRLRDVGIALPQISFNAAYDTLCDAELPETLLWEVLDKGLSPADLAVEVAESALIADADGVVEHNIAVFADLGFDVLIDDFGTGHASTAQMQRLKIRGLKLGPALTKHLSDPCRQAILRAILAMAGELNLTVTAKSVADEGAIDHLRALGVHRAQGNAIAPPFEAAALPGYLDRRAGRARRLAV